MRRLIVSMLMLVLLSACAGRNPTPQATLWIVATSTPGIAQGNNPTLEPSPAPLASPTPVPLSLILTEFPLAVGATWVYSAEIVYEDPSDSAKQLSWIGLVTDRIVEKRTEPGGKLIFTVQEDMDPLPPEPVWRHPRTFEYIITGDGVFTDSGRVYQYPIQEGQNWPALGDSGYEMTVQALGEVSTPYGRFDSCYSLVLATNPDITMDTFCAGMGFVEHSYRHWGTAQDEKFVLSSYTPGQP